ncbi:glycosyltransferase [Patescibacteria group bacterium]|nr:glycosyltransferase [Patescibacteria group bacterium]
MQAPVDVLIPTFNPNPDHLREALNSLKNQTFTNCRALIHDDASESNVQAMVEPYLEDSRFTFERSEKRLGIGGNWNACLKKTSSPIVAYLFQDDVWYPNYLETAVKAFEANPSVGFVSLNHEYKIEGTMQSEIGYIRLRKMKEEQLASGIHQGQLFLKQWLKKGLWPNMIGEPDFVVIKRSVMEQAGPFHEGMDQLLDTDYWARLLTITDFYYVNEDMGSFRVHEAAASALNQRRGISAIDRFKMLSEIAKKSSSPLPGTARMAQVKLCGKVGLHCVRHPIGSAKAVRGLLGI